MNTGDWIGMDMEADKNNLFYYGERSLPVVMKLHKYTSLVNADFWLRHFRLFHSPS